MRLLWVDIETTGLDPHRHKMLEIALVETDEDGEIVFEFPHVIHVEDVLDYITEDVVSDMHESSGLIDECSIKGINTKEYVEGFLYGMNLHNKGIRMAGTGVHFDRAWLKVHMPRLESLFSCRSFDMSTLRAFLGWPKHDERPHRALADLRQDIQDYQGMLSWMETKAFREAP